MVQNLFCLVNIQHSGGGLHIFGADLMTLAPLIYAARPPLFGAGVFGNGLSALGHSVLGQLARQ